jgi:DNA-binding NarL/FixJ family response regulator
VSPQIKLSISLNTVAWPFATGFNELHGYLYRCFESADLSLCPVRILIADDHESVRSQIRCVLEAQHWDVCGEAENGEEAVEKVRQLKPDLIILDMNMPILNGYEAAQEIRRRSPSTKVLILTLHDDANFPSVLNETGADAYLAKTRAAAELVPTIKHFC